MRQFIAIMLSLTLVASGFAQGPVGPSVGAGTPARTSAVRNSFGEITSRLDPGGNLYLYVSTEELLKGLSTQVSQWRALFENAPDMSADDRRNIGHIFDLIASLIKNSGIEEVSGFGLSSIAVEKDLYRVTSMLHHYKDSGSGYLWSLMGKKAHPLTGLDVMPSSTALAYYTDLDLPLLWSAVNDEVGKSGIPGAREMLQSLPGDFRDLTGAELSAVLGSLGGEYGVALTLDEARMMALPLPDGSTLRIPEIGGILFVKTRNDTIFNLVDGAIGGDPEVLKTDRAGFRMRALAPPPGTETSFRPAIAQAGDYLMVSSNSALIEEAVAARAGARPGLKSTDVFKRLSRDVPAEGNSFFFVSPKVGQTIVRAVSQTMNSGAVDPAQGQLISNLFGNGGWGSYSVSASGEEGWLSVGNTTLNPASILMAPLVAVPLIISAVAVPSLLRSRQSANEAAAIANLRNIHLAELAYYLDSNKYGDMRSLVSNGLLDARFLTAISGYNFEIDVTIRGDFLAKANPVDSNTGRWGYYVMADGVVRYAIDPQLAPPGESGRPIDGTPSRRGIVRKDANDNPAAVARTAP